MPVTSGITPTNNREINWADLDVDEENINSNNGQNAVDGDIKFPSVHESVDPKTGIHTVIEYKIDPETKNKLKITKQYARKFIKEELTKGMLERRSIKKFGVASRFPPGPDSNSTSLGEKVILKLSSRMKAEELESKTDTNIKKPTRNIQCRRCKGTHFTSQCPYKDTIADPDGEAEALDSRDSSRNPNVYITPSRRAGAVPGDSTESRNRENSLRITNISEDATPEEVEAMFRVYPGIEKVYVAYDRDNKRCKGYAYVSFYDREYAETCRNSMRGKGFRNLILEIDFAESR